MQHILTNKKIKLEVSPQDAEPLEWMQGKRKRLSIIGVLVSAVFNV